MDKNAGRVLGLARDKLRSLTGSDRLSDRAAEMVNRDLFSDRKMSVLEAVRNLLSTGSTRPVRGLHTLDAPAEARLRRLARRVRVGQEANPALRRAFAMGIRSGAGKAMNFTQAMSRARYGQLRTLFGGNLALTGAMAAPAFAADRVARKVGKVSGPVDNARNALLNILDKRTHVNPGGRTAGNSPMRQKLVDLLDWK